MHLIVSYFSFCFAGTELNAVLDVVLSCTAQLITYLPLESELITAAAQTLIALSASKNNARLAYVVNHESVGNIAQYVTSTSTSSSASGSNGGGSNNNSNNSGCRLNAVGLVAMYESLGMVFVRSGHEAYFTHVSNLTFNTCFTIYKCVRAHVSII